MSGTSYKLWCLIEKEKAPFPVTIPSNILISELKERLKAIRENALKTVDAPTLTLWEVCYFLVICSDIMGDTTLPIGQCGLEWDKIYYTSWRISSRYCQGAIV